MSIDGLFFAQPFIEYLSHPAGRAATEPGACCIGIGKCSADILRLSYFPVLQQ